MSRCAFIGFGSAASAMAEGLRESGLGAVFFHTRSLPSERHAGRIKAAGAVYRPDYASLAASSDVIISCVTGAAAREVAEAAAPCLRGRHVYVDANTAAPGVKRDIAALITSTGAAFADAAIMGPVESLRHRVPIIACGDGAGPFRDAMSPFGMTISVIEGPPGQAATIKLLRSVFQKGVMCLLMETLGAARHYGADAAVLDSLCRTFDGVPLRVMAERMVPKAVSKAGRMTHEMMEAYAMLTGEGLPALMTEACARSLARCRAEELPEPENVEQAIRLLNGLSQRLPFEEGHPGPQEPPCLPASSPENPLGRRETPQSVKGRESR